MKMFAATSGVGTATTYTANFCPAWLYWNNSTVPQGLKVTVLGDGVICDLDAKGIAAISWLGTEGNITNGFCIPLADGVCVNKTTEIVFTNGVAAAIDVYGFGEKLADSYFVTKRQTITASSPYVIENFLYLGLPDIASGDQMQVLYVDGLQQKVDNVDLLALQSIYENNANLTNNKGLANFQQRIDRVTFIPAAQETVFLVMIEPVGNVEM